MSRQEWQRTVGCGKVSETQMGDVVVLNGWAHSVRDHGQVVFIDLRDRTGLVQIVADPARGATGDRAFAAAKTVRSETCVSVTGTVVRRQSGMENPNLATGAIEIEASDVKVLGPSKPLPFPVDGDAPTNEEVRLRHRYLDLRRPAMYRKMRLRHEIVRAVREYFYRHDFLEIETPVLTKSSPEGARDYLVPYRLEPGKFYALPQAPQQFKQLLMVGGIDRYFQIAKCFRDESQRADRQPEFTQIDLEMGFATQNDVLALVEALMIEIVGRFAADTGKTVASDPFPRFTYDEALRRFGSDKPDIRFDLELVDCGEVFAATEFGVFRQVLDQGGQVKAIRYPGGARIPRREMDELVALSRDWGAKGMSYVLVEDDGTSLRGTLAKFVTDAERPRLIAAAAAEPGDLIGFIADQPEVVAKVLDRMRRHIGRTLKLIDDSKMAYCWIVDFPVFERDEDTGSLTFAHNPFAMPRAEDLDKFDTDPLGMRAQCYDLVCNGAEAASGAVRIHVPEIQEKVFRLMGLDDRQIADRFGHMLEAFRYGAPPHAGIAPGLDRLVMLLCDEDNIREVIAFPKMGGGGDPLMDAPSVVEPEQLRDLGIRVDPVERSS
ncbi:MAG: aspartate--tRNA ligase [Armatimonadota bacterium]